MDCREKMVLACVGHWYSPKWNGQGFVGLKEFGDVILDDLWCI